MYGITVSALGTGSLDGKGWWSGNFTEVGKMMGLNWGDGFFLS